MEVHTLCDSNDKFYRVSEDDARRRNLLPLEPGQVKDSPRTLGSLLFPAMSTIQEDFDRIALVSEDGATHNDHYHNFLLRHLPANCHEVLEIGCGTGTFARSLAERSDHVLAFDLSREMIRLARERSAQFTNLEFELADICVRQLP